jgi:hypothetical protein
MNVVVSFTKRYEESLRFFLHLPNIVPADVSFVHMAGSILRVRDKLPLPLEIGGGKRGIGVAKPSQVRGPTQIK